MKRAWTDRSLHRTLIQYFLSSYCSQGLSIICNHFYIRQVSFYVNRKFSANGRRKLEYIYVEAEYDGRDVRVPSSLGFRFLGMEPTRRFVSERFWLYWDIWTCLFFPSVSSQYTFSGSRERNPHRVPGPRERNPCRVLSSRNRTKNWHPSTVINFSKKNSIFSIIQCCCWQPQEKNPWNQKVASIHCYTHPRGVGHCWLLNVPCFMW